ncbi:hypothetical protein Dimus_021167 [Dionaea muscipula]
MSVIGPTDQLDNKKEPDATRTEPPCPEQVPTAVMVSSSPVAIQQAKVGPCNRTHNGKRTGPRLKNDEYVWDRSKVGALNVFDEMPYCLDCYFLAIAHTNSSCSMINLNAVLRWCVLS